MAPGPRIARHTPKKDAFVAEVPLGENLLYAAAEHIRFTAADVLPEADPHEISSELNILCDLLESDAPRSFPATEDAGSKLLLRAKLIGMLRAEALRVWAECPPTSPTQMLRILQGFERLQAELESFPIYDEMRQRLYDSRGLELVVELAHDLRSPLTSILFLSETLMRGGSGPVNEIQQRQLGIVYSAALGLIGTASDVIELARGGEHLEISEASAFSIAEIFEGVRDMVMPIAEEKGLELRIETLDPDRRFGHPVPLSRVLLNLTTNALKFTDSGRVELLVQPVSSTRVELAVRDTGRGIDDAAMATLFQPIRRRSVGRRGYQITGTGLGLSICRKLVAAMGGELQLETRANFGTRFFFEIELPPV